MNIFGHSIVAGMLALAAPAFCDVPAGLIGQWQDPSHPSAVIQEFQPDGTDHALTRSDGQLVPVRQKDGSEMIVKYTINGDKMVFTSLDGKYSEEHPFKLEGNILSFLPSGKFHNTAILHRLPPPAPSKDPAPTPPGQ